MKRIFIISAVLSLLAQSAFAADLTADAVIENDGSAKIKETVSGVFNEGEEICLPIDLSGLYFSDFEVSDSEGVFEYVSDWENLSTFEEKSRKCGIVKGEDGTRLCLGISSYGEKSYTVSYTLDHFAKGYNECDVSDFVFLNPSAGLYPANVTVRFTLGNGRSLEKDDTSVWAFGCRSSVSYADGGVTVTTKKALEKDEYLRVMMSTENGMINPTVYLKEPFENKKSAVFEETGCSENHGAAVIAISAAIAAVAAAAVIAALKMKCGRRKSDQNTKSM